MTTAPNPLAELSKLRIDTEQTWEVHYWMRKLSVDEERLRRAVDACGSRLVCCVEMLLVEAAAK